MQHSSLAELFPPLASFFACNALWTQLDGRLPGPPPPMTHTLQPIVTTCKGNGQAPLGSQVKDYQYMHFKNKLTSLTALQNSLWRTLCKACNFWGGTSPLLCNFSSNSIARQISGGRYNKTMWATEFYTSNISDVLTCLPKICYSATNHFNYIQIFPLQSSFCISHFQINEF